MIIHFIRHGETEYNCNDVVNGHAEDMLTEEGIRMAKDLGKKLMMQSVDALFASDSQRTYDTAKYIIEGSGWDISIVLDKRLRERCYGKYEGGSYDILRSDRRALGMNFDEFCEYSSEIESPQSIIKRWNDFFESKLAGQSYENVYIVSHGGFIRLIFMYVMGIDSDYYFSHFDTIQNCSITSFKYTTKGSILKQFNA